LLCPDPIVYPLSRSPAGSWTIRERRDVWWQSLTAR
jgi:hypothetical protein